MNQRGYTAIGEGPAACTASGLPCRVIGIRAPGGRTAPSQARGRWNNASCERTPQGVRSLDTPAVTRWLPGDRW